MIVTLYYKNHKQLILSKLINKNPIKNTKKERIYI